MKRYLILTLLLVFSSQTIASAQSSRATLDNCAERLRDDPACVYELAKAEIGQEDASKATLKAIAKDYMRDVGPAERSLGLGHELIEAADRTLAAEIARLDATQTRANLMGLDAWPSILLSNRLFRATRALYETRHGTLDAGSSPELAVTDAIHDHPVIAFEKAMALLSTEAESTDNGKKAKQNVPFWTVVHGSLLRSLIAAGEIDMALAFIKASLASGRRFQTLALGSFQGEFTLDLTPFGSENLQRFTDALEHPKILAAARVQLIKEYQRERKPEKALEVARALPESPDYPGRRSAEDHVRLAKKHLIGALIARGDDDAARALTNEDNPTEADLLRLEQKIMVGKIKHAHRAGGADAVRAVFDAEALALARLKAAKAITHVASVLVSLGLDDEALALSKGVPRTYRTVYKQIFDKLKPLNIQPSVYTIYGELLYDRAPEALRQIEFIPDEERFGALIRIYLFAKAAALK